MALSPMMQQYMNIKENYADAILFFRLGDFYEMFFEDALKTSKALELTLTGKNCGLEERAPMCGVPFHSYETYASKLVSLGYKVAICEQVEDPQDAKGIVKREVVQVITPGTMTLTQGLKESENNYLASVVMHNIDAAVAYCDITTGDVVVADFNQKDFVSEMVNHLIFMAPKEIIGSENVIELLTEQKIKNYLDVFFTAKANNFFSKDSSEATIKSQYGVHNISSLGLDVDLPSTSALGSLLSYLLNNQKQTLSNLKSPVFYHKDGCMTLDKATIRNLELTETLFEKKVRGSLLGILDKTHTAMGGRKIKNWIKEPLKNLDNIQARLDAVETLVEDPLLRNNIKENLKGIYDFDRLAGKVALGSANARDLLALHKSLTYLPEIKLDIEGYDAGILTEIYNSTETLEDVREYIDESIHPEAPLTLKEGSLIKDGFSKELDKLKADIKDSKDWIASLEASERERTGIKNLKVGYNKVFGYYLEITRSYYDMIPEEYIRKQTLANAERFITPKLKEVEALVLNAESKINKLEYQIFNEIKDRIKAEIPRIQTTSEAIATLDVITSFAHVSNNMDYVKPVLTLDDEIKIINGRHPVIENSLTDSLFVPNDTYINMSDSSLLLITGPNMAGKSTYMRQTAIIVLMAQIGCFVPCSSCEIGIVDNIFTRIGASDNLAGGQSTFYVEMSELGYILNSATNKSLIILDEIGRGTSTYDGLSIAWSLCEYLCENKNRARTLFATHYHELTALEDSLTGLKNLNVEVSDNGEEVVFLHKIIAGKASRSYGIHVAKMAGIPEALLDSAEERLILLEKQDKARKEHELKKKEKYSQFSLFDN